ncbi:response regulator [Pseudomarimonas arenosa]|uniref:Response regulator n=1 Tax=Pseudomarimonas arenosa TaxID=2774145 RepID=A0AAW3ZLR6_9GAMM|nr:response regulator [Pseudomarimonas arenosa]MBD8526007.1 response regulator [Pseudomarimonas arenosa]
MNSTGTPTKLLVVDDDPSLLQLLALTLQQAGFQVYTAECRDDALEIARAEPDIQIALCDLGLPPRPNEITEGIHLVEQLLMQRPDMKAIVITGQDQESAALAAIRAGAFDFLAKPVQAVQIRAAVDRAQLFASKEATLRDAGESRITIATRVDEGIREAGEAAEERLLRQVLADTGFNVAEASRRLGLQRENLYYFMKKYGIKRDA